MKPFIKNLTALGIGALSLFCVTTASAQRLRVGIGLGYGYPYYGPRIGYYYNPYGGYYGYAYPRIGLSFGYSPYYMPFYFGSDLYYQYNGIYYRRSDDNVYHVVAPPVGAEVTRLPGHAHSLLINNQQYFELSGVYYKPNPKPDGTTDYIIAGKDGVLSTYVVPQPPAPPAPPLQHQPTWKKVPEPAPAPQNVNPPQQNIAPPLNEVAPPGDAPQANDAMPALPPTPTDAPAAPVVKTGDVVTALPDGCKAVTVAGKKYFVSADDVYYEEFNNKGKVNYKVQGTPNNQ